MSKRQHPHEPHEVEWDHVVTHKDEHGHEHKHFQCKACGHIGSYIPRIPGRKPNDPPAPPMPPLHFCQPPEEK